MLDAQLETFRGLDPKTWRNFLLFFGSFDAAVLMASIFIFFPREHADLASKALVEFQETQSRFGTCVDCNCSSQHTDPSIEIMRERNKLARAAQGVLAAIYGKFKNAIESQIPARSMSSASTIGSPDSGRDSSGTAATSVDMLLNNPPGLTPGSNSSHQVSPAVMPKKVEDMVQYLPPPTDWSMPADLNWDFGNMAPLFPMGDVIYNDLSALDNSMHWGTGAAPVAAVPAFEGDFGGDSFWSLMNQYNRGPM